MPLFEDISAGFEKILSDPGWLWKTLLGGFLLINPFLLGLSPYVCHTDAHPTWKILFWICLGLNVLTFWFPLGFTYEVLRRAVRDNGKQLPDWHFSHLPRYAFEGGIKLIISIFTLIVPTLLWAGGSYGLVVHFLKLPEAMLPMFVQPVFLFVIPFCAVGCCRWLDGESVLSCSLNYYRNFLLFKKAWKEYIIASLFLIGLNTITTAFFFTIPFAVVFGLCLVDTWFGPIYARSNKISKIVD